MKPSPLPASIEPASIDDIPPNRFHQLLTARTAGGWLTVGYALSILGVALTPAAEALGLTVSWQGLVAAAALVGIAAGGFLGGWLTGVLGRRPLFLAAPAIILIGSGLTFGAGDGATLALLRFCVGLAVGVEYAAAGSLLVEFLPQKARGRRLSLLTLMWFAGAALAYIVGVVVLAVSPPDGWRYVLASPAVLGGLLLLFRLGTPESPRWLISKGRHPEAERIIKDVYGSDFSLRNLPRPQSAPTGQSFIAALRSGYGRRILFVSVFWSCATLPMFAIYAFVPRLLEALALGDAAATYGSVGIALMFVSGCYVAMRLIGRIGRRPLLINSFLWAGTALAVLGLFPNAPAWAALGLLGAYAVFVGGAQVLSFIYPNELFPTEIRASAIGLGAAVSSLSSAAGAWLTPVALTTAGVGATLIAAGGVCFVGVLISIVLAPETHHLTLEEAASLNH